MPRKLALVTALMATLWAGSALAVGLGEITLHSALNQKLDAEIELLEVGGLDATEILASLASSEDFARVGVERFFYLTGLRFSVERRQGGRAVVRLTSAQPITEPYLNFLVQVLWPSGRMLKEYTVLLDPPTFADQSAPAVSAPGRSDPGGGPAGRVERTPTRPDSQVSFDTPRSETRPPPEDRHRDGSYGMTDRDDTLWTIALKTRPSSRVSVQQHMLALERLNPEAFIGGNINLLKAGYVLKLPTEAQASELDTSQAIAEVARHHREWEAYRDGQPLPSVAGTSARAPEETATEPSTALAGQVDATARPQTAARPAGTTDGELRIVAGAGAGSGGGGEDAQAVENRLVASEEERDRISRENDELVYRLDRMSGDLEQTERQIEVRDQQIANLQARLAELEQQQAVGGAPRTAAAAPTRARSATDWLQSPLVLGGLALLVVGGAAWGLIAARRRRAGEAAARDDFYPRPATSRARSDAGRIAPIAVTEESPAENDEQGWPEEQEDEAASAEAPGEDDESIPGAQTSDVIGEADIYIAYGRYPQAIGLLLAAVDEDPDRSDVRLKLLELYTETKNEEGFAAQMGELVNRCDDESLLLEARALEAKLRDEDSAGERAVLAPSSSDGDPRGVDEFSLDLELDDAEPVSDPRPVARNPTPAPSGGAGDELGGDLGLDFDPDAEPTVLRDPKRSRSAAPGRNSGTDAAVEFDLEDLDVEPAAKPSGDGDDAFDFLDEEDAASTKLDLARAYIEMGDEDGARDILSEVLQEGSRDQQQQANELLEKLS